jgi:hypothetical protein
MTTSLKGQEQRMTFRLLSYWSRVRAGRIMPALKDVNISEIQEIYHFTFTIKMESEEGPVFEYFGPELAGTFGQDYTGIPLEEALADTMVDNTIGFYEKVLESKQPHSESSEFFLDGREVRYRSIILPCSSNEFNVDYLIGTTNYKIFD